MKGVIKMLKKGIVLTIIAFLALYTNKMVQLLSHQKKNNMKSLFQIDKGTMRQMKKFQRSLYRRKRKNLSI